MKFTWTSYEVNPIEEAVGYHLNLCGEPCSSAVVGVTISAACLAAKTCSDPTTPLQSLPTVLKFRDQAKLSEARDESWRRKDGTEVTILFFFSNRQQMEGVSRCFPQATTREKSTVQYYDTSCRQFQVPTPMT